MVSIPFDITDDGPLNIGRGRGRMIPSLAWESIWNGVIQHMGVESEAELDMCLPNRKNTAAVLFTETDLLLSAYRLLRG